MNIPYRRQLIQFGYYDLLLSQIRDKIYHYRNIKIYAIIYNRYEVCRPVILDNIPVWKFDEFQQFLRFIATRYAIS